MQDEQKQPSDRRIGWVGLGAMGRPLARHLAKAGYAFTVFDLDLRATDEFEALGATAVGDVSEVGARSEIVFACLPNLSASESVFSKILAGSSRPKIYVELSTLGPSDVRAIAARAEAAGMDFMDAPVSGTIVQRAEGTMTLFCGAERTVFEEVRAIASHFAEHMFLLGPAGSGSVGKVCNQLMIMTGLITAIECVELGTRQGLEVEPLLESIMASAGSARSLTFVAREYLHRTYRKLEQPRGALRLAVKDLDLAVLSAREVGLQVEMAEAALAVWRRAEAAGLGGADLYNIIDHVVTPNKQSGLAVVV